MTTSSKSQSSIFSSIGSSTALGLVTSIIVIYVVGVVYRSYQRLAHIPGPSSAHWSKWWMIRATATGEMPFRLGQISQRYGSLARIGPNDVITDDAETLRMINGLRSTYVRSDWYNATAFSHDLNHAFCERDDDLHADRRTKLIPGYSGREIEGMEAAMDNRIEDFCALIERKYLSNDTDFRPVDLARICSYFTLEVIYTLAFGNTMGFLEKDEDVYGYLSNQKQMLPIFEWLSTLPSLEKFLRTPWISRNIMPKKTDKTGIGLLFGFAEDAVAKRRGGKYKDMLGSFLEHGITDAEAVQESVLQVIAGSDTTASTIRMILFYTMTNPLVYRRLKEELDSRSTLSTPISDAETRELPYLEACIKEGMRMWPPVVGLMSKVVPPSGANILGHWLPGGTCIGYSAWGVMRKTKTFGADADIYRPERWLEDASSDEAAKAEMDKSLDLVFGYGKNACLGKPIAQIEMRKTVAELLRRFDMSIVRPERPFNSVNRNGLFIQDDMLVRIVKRE